MKRLDGSMVLFVAHFFFSFFKFLGKLMFHGVICCSLFCFFLFWFSSRMQGWIISLGTHMEMFLLVDPKILAMYSYLVSQWNGFCFNNSSFTMFIRLIIFQTLLLIRDVFQFLLIYLYNIILIDIFITHILYLMKVFFIL